MTGKICFLGTFSPLKLTNTALPALPPVFQPHGFLFFAVFHLFLWFLVFTGSLFQFFYWQ
jgi:hypothetical protein